MTLATRINRVSYLKSNAADIVKNEKQQEQFALLRLIALGRKEYQAGNYSDVHAFFDEMDKEELAEKSSF